MMIDVNEASSFAAVRNGARAKRGSAFAQRIQDGYLARFSGTIGLRTRRQDVQHVKADLAMLEDLAEWWNYARHAPTDVSVRIAYERLIDETVLQYQFARECGLRFELFLGPPERQPYEGNDAVTRMVTDIDINRRLIVWPYATMPLDHPLAKPIPDADGWTAMNVLRGVHDALGHAPGEHGLTLTGEERAFCEHSQLYTDSCRGALAAEFRGPLAWLFFGGHVRRVDGSLPKRDDTDFANWTERPYPEQKATLVPPRFWKAAIDDVGFSET